MLTYDIMKVLMLTACLVQFYSYVNAAGINFCSGVSRQYNIDPSTYLVINGSDVAINGGTSGSGGGGTTLADSSSVARVKRLASDVEDDIVTSCTCHIRQVPQLSADASINVELTTGFSSDCPKSVDVSPDDVEFTCYSQILPTTLIAGVTLTLKTETSREAPVLYTNEYYIKLWTGFGTPLTVDVMCDLPVNPVLITMSTTSTTTPSTSTTLPFTLPTNGTDVADSNMTQVIAVVTPTINPTFIVVGVVLGLCVITVALIVCVVLLLGRHDIKHPDPKLPLTSRGRLYRRVQHTATQVWKSVRRKRPLPEIPSTIGDVTERHKHVLGPNDSTRVYDSIRSHGNRHDGGYSQSSAQTSTLDGINSVSHLCDMNKSMLNSNNDLPILRHHDVIVHLSSGPYLHPVSESLPEDSRRDSGYMEHGDTLQIHQTRTIDIQRNSSINTQDSGYANMDTSEFDMQEGSLRSSGNGLTLVLDDAGYIPMNTVRDNRSTCYASDEDDGRQYKNVTKNSHTNNAVLKASITPQESNGYMRINEVGK